MNTFNQFQSVPLSSINFEDRTYCLAPWDHPPGENLLASIKRFGILHPPILQQVEDNSYCIVAGRKRVSAIQHLAPESHVFCRISPADTKEPAIFALLLEEAKTGKPLSITEQIIFFGKLLQKSSMDDAIPMLEQLGYKPQKHILKDLLKLSSLSESVLQGLHYGAIQTKTARKLLNFSEADQKLIVRLITELHFGGSKQQKLTDLCAELIMRENLPLENILADFLSTHDQEEPVNIPQHGAALLLWLHNKCFPRISQAENNFKRQVARLKLPSSMHIAHTPAFEDEEITLSLRFPDWRSFDKVLQNIYKLMQKK